MNNQLTPEIQEEITDKATEAQNVANRISGHLPDGERLNYIRGVGDGYIKGGTEYATKNTSATWLTGQYDRLYDQLKAKPERKIVCWVNYDWRWKNDYGTVAKETLRDICAIMGKVMGFNARGIGYGGCEIWINTADEKKEFLEECARLNVQWLDEKSVPTQKDELFHAIKEIADYKHECGCMPCTGQCRSVEALEIEIEELKEIAINALKNENI